MLVRSSFGHMNFPGGCSENKTGVDLYMKTLKITLNMVSQFKFIIPGTIYHKMQNDGKKVFIKSE